MLDIRQLRSDPQGVAANLARRGFALDLEQFTTLEARRKEVADNKKYTDLPGKLRDQQLSLAQWVGVVHGGECGRRHRCRTAGRRGEHRTVTDGT